jgi:hypothetical protein
VTTIPQKETTMKYHVTYRLFHPQSLSTISVAVIQASSHVELDAKVAKIKTKWQARGYIVQIMQVRQQKQAKRKQHS